MRRKRKGEKGLRRPAILKFHVHKHPQWPSSYHRHIDTTNRKIENYSLGRLTNDRESHKRGKEIATCEKRHLLPSFAVTTATSFRKHLGGLDSGGVTHLLLLVVERPPEEHDVRLRAVDRVVHPSPALLHPDRPPLVLVRPSQPTQSVFESLSKGFEGGKWFWWNPSIRGASLLTSERRRFLGSNLATSGGSTTCLHSKKERSGGDIAKIDRHLNENCNSFRRNWVYKGTRRIPVLVGVIEVLLRVLDLTHFDLPSAPTSPPRSIALREVPP